MTPAWQQKIRAVQNVEVQTLAEGECLAFHDHITALLSQSMAAVNRGELGVGEHTKACKLFYDKGQAAIRRATLLRELGDAA
jgi:hypothetical protein